LATPLNQTGDTGQPVFNQPALLDAISVFAIKSNKLWQKCHILIKMLK
jgi:hypothetical protein